MLIISSLFYILNVYAQPSGNLGQLTAFEKLQGDSKPYAYYEYLPQNYASGQLYPLVLFLHGRGERGNGQLPDLDKVLRHGPMKRIGQIINNPNSSAGRHFPAIIIAPQSSGGHNPGTLEALIQYLITVGYPIDMNKIYVTGLSAGGGAVWKFGELYPNLTAAIVPVCGANRVANPSPHLQSMPIWAFHNYGDAVVRRAFTAQNVDRISNTGGPTVLKKNYLYPYTYPNPNDPRELGAATTDQTFQFDGTTWSIASGVNMPTYNLAFTLYKASGHNAWAAAYYNDAMWTWLFAQSKSVVNAPPIANAGADIQMTTPQSTVTLDGSASFDSDGAIASYQWTLISGPVATAVAPILVNFSYTPTNLLAAAPWNNTLGQTQLGTTITNLVNDQNNLTGTSLNLLNAWSAKLSGLSTGTNSGVMPDDVIATTYWIKGRGVARQIVIDGLSPNGLYDLTFYGGRKGAGNKNTRYSVGNQSGILNASDNTTQSVILANIGANGAGEILFEVDTANGSKYAYLNGLIISPKAMVPTIQTPQGITTIVSNLSIGTYIFELEVTDNQGAVHTDQVSVVVNNSSVLRRHNDNETFNNQEVMKDVISVFPNPAESVLNLTNIPAEIKAVTIVNISGRIVYHSNSISDRVVIPTLDWAKGIYFLTFRNVENEVETRKIIKK